MCDPTDLPMPLYFGGLAFSSSWSWVFTYSVGKVMQISIPPAMPPGTQWHTITVNEPRHKSKCQLKPHLVIKKFFPRFWFCQSHAPHDNVVRLLCKRHHQTHLDNDPQVSSTDKQNKNKHPLVETCSFKINFILISMCAIEKWNKHYLGFQKRYICRKTFTFNNSVVVNCCTMEISMYFRIERNQFPP